MQEVCELFQKFEKGSSDDKEEDDDLVVGPLEPNKALLFPNFMQSSLPIRAPTSTETEAPRTLDKGTPGASSSTNNVTISVASTSTAHLPH